MFLPLLNERPFRQLLAELEEKIKCCIPNDCLLGMGVGAGHGEGGGWRLGVGDVGVGGGVGVGSGWCGCWGRDGGGEWVVWVLGAG